MSLGPWDADDGAVDGQAAEIGFHVEVDWRSSAQARYVMDVETGGRADEIIRWACAVTGLEPEDFLRRLFIDSVHSVYRRAYVRGVVEEEQLWRLLAARTAGRASVAELQVILDRLAQLQADNLSLAKTLPLERDAVIVALQSSANSDDLEEHWPPLPKPSRAGKGGRPRVGEGDDWTWLRQLVEAIRIHDIDGLPWSQAAARLGISEFQLNESRRRVGLLDSD